MYNIPNCVLNLVDLNNVMWDVGIKESSKYRKWHSFLNRPKRNVRHKNWNGGSIFFWIWYTIARLICFSLFISLWTSSFLCIYLLLLFRLIFFVSLHLLQAMRPFILYYTFGLEALQMLDQVLYVCLSINYSIMCLVRSFIRLWTDMFNPKDVCWLIFVLFLCYGSESLGSLYPCVTFLCWKLGVGDSMDCFT